MILIFFGVFVLMDWVFFKFSTASKMMVYGVYMMACFFTLGWVFNIDDNYSRLTYYIITGFSSFLTILIFWFVFKRRRNRFEIIADHKQEIFDFVKLNYKSPEELSEIGKIIERQQKELKKTL